ncbi:MAG: DNA primase [Candidatus Marinimicrobia bacterium]|nr:DNA primase [Candidatus Neomarinimicrobiota bacterium]|tara:strand:- start:2691 stop:4457 length:1767 start_codon:yes stop_codon:yes gene_type:complete
MARVPEETIERIRNTADIYDVVAQYVDLKKRGRNFFGLCPFHSEKTPSFSVAPDKQIYHCFGCGAGGNVFSFIVEHEKISFIEAVKQLGHKYGIQVDYQSGPANKIFSSLYELHDIAVKLYHNILFSEKGKAALDYLHNRGFNDDTIKTYHIGFAPDSWDTLSNTIKTSSFKDNVYEKTGLFIKTDRGWRDRFRSRIMFPIYHQSGKAIAFGGRIFNNNDPAKYLNSPETPLYRKSEVFYGLHKTRDSIRKFSTAVLVEGYTDFLQLVQLGIPNVVALSGTALGNNHASQIRKFASKVYLAYDGDDAGINATLRAGYVLFQAGVEPLVIPMPNDKDPDDWVREEGVNAFQEAMGSSMPLLLFHLHKRDVKNLSGTDRSRIVKEILKEISLINDGIIRDDLLKSLSQELQLDEVEVYRLFNSQTGMKKINVDSDKYSAKTQPFTNAMQKAQLEIIRAIAFNFDEVYPSMKNIIDFQIFDEPILQKIGLFLIKDNKPKDLSAIIDQFENMDEKRLVSEILFDDVSSDDPQLIISECIATIKGKLIKDQIKQARIKIRELESSGEDAKEIIIQVIELQNTLHQLTENIETE